MRLIVLLVAGSLAACSVPPSTPSLTELTFLVDMPPAAALDAVAAWAGRVDDLRVDRLDDGLLIRDRRGGQRNQATVAVGPRADGLTAVTVSSEYVLTPGFRDLGVILYSGQQGERRAAYGVPRPGSPTCLSLDDWRADAAEVSAPRPPDAEPVEEVAPELVGGLRGLQERLVYPERMRRAGVMGVVLVEFVVGETGAVECAQVVSSPHPEFSEAARAAVLASAFTPGTQGGRPVSIRFTVPLTFALR